MTDTKALRALLAKGDAWIGQRAEMVRDGRLTMGESQDVVTLRDLLDEVEALRAEVDGARVLEVRLCDDLAVFREQMQKANEKIDALRAQVESQRPLVEAARRYKHATGRYELESGRAALMSAAWELP